MAVVQEHEQGRTRLALTAALVASILLIFIIDIVDPAVSMYSYLALPIAASAALGSPSLTAALAGVVVVLGAIDGIADEDLTAPSGWARYVLMLLTIGAAIGLAAFMQRWSVRQVQATKLLRAAMRSGLDAHVFLRPLRTPSRVITDFVFVEANDVACTFLQRSRNELIGHGLVELFPAFANTSQFGMFTRLANTGEPLIVEASEFQSVVRGRTLFDIRGVRVDSVLSISWRDVSASIETRKLLAQSEEHFRLLAEHATDVVWRTGPSGAITWVSPSVSRTLGWDPAEVIGRTAADFVHPDDIARAQAAKASAPAEATLHLTVRLRTKDGDYRDIAVIGSNVFDADGTITGRAGGWRDVTEETAVLRDLAAAEARFRMLATTTSDVLFQTGKDRAITWVSPSVETTLGWRIDELVGRSAESLVHPDDLRALAPQRTDAAVEDASGDFTLRIAHGNGGYRWMSVSTVAVSGNEEMRVTRMHDVEEGVRLTHFLQHQANTDALTGLVNRREALDRLEAMTRERRVGSHLGLLLIDIDLFKDINDGHGHAAGDSVLQALATRIASQVRESDVTARLGGDELLVILNGVESAEAAEMIAHHIRVACGQPIELADGRTVSTTVSVGVALALDGESPSSVLERADAAMYDAKRAGRDGIATSRTDD